MKQRYKPPPGSVKAITRHLASATPSIVGYLKDAPTLLIIALATPLIAIHLFDFWVYCRHKELELASKKQFNKLIFTCFSKLTVEVQTSPTNAGYDDNGTLKLIQILLSMKNDSYLEEKDN